MKDEIKEILDDLDNKECYINNETILTFDEAKTLLDYITNLQEQLHQAGLDIQELTERDIECPSWCNKLTNLQEENERLTQGVTLLTNKLIDMTKEKEDYKSRNDKAIDNCKKSIESINQKLQDDKTIKVVDGKVLNMNEYQIVRLKAIRMKCKELLAILGDKENG